MSAAVCFSNPVPRNVRLYGRLGAKYGRTFKLAVATTAEAVRALCRMLPGFEREMMESKDRGVDYAVFVGKRNISENELHSPCGGADIRIAPIVRGAKKGGIFQIIIGVVLVVVGTVLSAYGFGAIGAPLVKLGWTMVIGGVIQLLTPAPNGSGSRDRPENTPSYVFNGSVNTQAQGNPVPLLYGELIVGSAVVSAGINVQDQAYAPVPTDPGDGSSMGNGSRGWWDYIFNSEA